MSADKPLRVLFLSRAYGPRGGGMERLSWELIRQMQEHPGVQPLVIAYQRLAVPLVINRILSVLVLVPIALRALAAARQADVVHLGDPLLAKIGWFIKRMWGKPIAVTVHGLDVSYPNPLYRLYLRMFFRHLDLYLPISTAAKKELDRWNVRSKVTVITPGIHDRFYEPSLTREDLASLLTGYSLPVTGDTKVLLTVGRLVRRKGHAWFIEHVLPHLPGNCLYVIAGDGPERKTTQQAVQQSGMEKRVIFLGQVGDETLKVLYNTVDAYIQPNIAIVRDPEGFGLVMIEAALCARSVFAARLDGIPDAIASGHNGTLIAAGNAAEWIRILNQFLIHPQANPAARQHTLDHFSWEHKAKEYIREFRAAGLPR